MYDIIQIEALLREDLWRKKLFHDLINNCPGNSEDLKPQESLRALFLLCFLFRSSPKNYSRKYLF